MTFTPLVIDVSHHQGDLDWPAIKAAGVVAAFIKLTEGAHFLDDMADKNWQGALDNLIFPAYYHYLHHGMIADQVEWFTDNASGFNGMAMAIDFEEPGLTLDDLLLAVDGFQSVGFRVAVYGSALLKEVVGDQMLPELGETALWVAQYRNSEPEWPTQVWPAWTFHQYTDGDVGGEPKRLPGIDQPIDLNRFNGSRRNCARWFLPPFPFPIPLPDPDPEEPPVVTVQIDVPEGVVVAVFINGEPV